MPSVHLADYVIVGGGSAGATLAGRLSEDAACSVLLIEAGDAAQSRWIDWPIGFFKTVGNSRYDWKFQTEPSAGLANRQINWPRGKGLGGSSLINGMLYLRGHQRDYDHWQALGNPGWSWQHVRGYFDKSAGGVAASPGGEARAAGPFHVTRLGPDTISDAFIQAAEACGIARTADFNRGDNSGAGYFSINTHQGRRVSSASAYLRPALHRPNLKVLTGCQALRVLTKGDKAIGVEIAQGGQVSRVESGREVIVSAGAIQSPQLLQLSGIGPSALLREHGIPVVRHAPGVGANLQDHLQVRPMFRCQGVETLNDVAHSRLKQIRELLHYQFGRQGSIAASVFRAGAFFSSAQGEAGWPDAQIHLALMSFDRPDLGPHRFPGITLSACMLRPRSRGTIAIRSADPRAAPRINAGYLDDAGDATLALELLKTMRRIAATAPLSKYIVAAHEAPGPAADDQELMAWIRMKALSIYHPAGTCAMGPASDCNAVVDARLRVHGLRGLRVVDASIMPTIVSGNTNAPTVMLAEYAADMIKADAGALANAA